LGIGEGTYLRANHLGEVGQNLGIKRIGFSQLAGRPRKIPDLSWIHHDDWEAVGGECAREGHFKPPSSLDHNAYWGQPTQVRHHGCPTGLIIRDGETCAWTHRHVELRLGDIDTDTHERVHRDLLDGPALRCGLVGPRNCSGSTGERA
jgi:hypothetical protein